LIKTLPGATNTLRVKTDGNTATFFINGTGPRGARASAQAGSASACPATGRQAERGKGGLQEREGHQLTLHSGKDQQNRRHFLEEFSCSSLDTGCRRYDGIYVFSSAARRRARNR
jgi:hypothetical protein